MFRRSCLLVWARLAFLLAPSLPSKGSRVQVIPGPFLDIPALVQYLEVYSQIKCSSHWEWMMSVVLYANFSSWYPGSVLQAYVKTFSSFFKILHRHYSDLLHTKKKDKKIIVYKKKDKSWYKNQQRIWRGTSEKEFKRPMKLEPFNHTYNQINANLRDRLFFLSN